MTVEKEKEATRIWTEEDARVFQRQTHGLVVVQLENERKAFVQMCDDGCSLL
jgi:hypothetical protein